MAKFKNLAELKIVMVSISALGNSEIITGYSKDLCKKMVLIKTPPVYAKGDEYPVCVIYENHSKAKEFELKLLKHARHIFIHPFIFALFIHLKNLVSVFIIFIKLRCRFDIYIGSGYMFTFLGLLLKCLGFTRKVIYFRCDYYEKNKFSFREWYPYILIRIFHLVDFLNLKFSDSVWHTSETMLHNYRESGARIARSHPQIVFKLGIMDQNKMRNKKYDTCDLAFIGNLKENQGIDLIIDTIPELIKVFPEIKLHIIGAGVYSDKLKRQVDENRLSRSVKFYGFLDNKNEVEKIFEKCILGLAPYSHEGNQFIRYSTPGKVFDYLSCGLPVIITDTTDMANEISHYGVGMVIDYSVVELKNAILKFLNDRDFLRESARNINEMSVKYSWSKIIKTAFSDTLEGWNSQ